MFFSILRNRNHSGIRIWDSSNPLAEEYVRSYTFVQRRVSGDYAISYANCKDYIHTGYAALSEGTPLLFNDVCITHVFTTV